MDYDREKFYRNLVSLFKLFRNRPHHLAKYLLDNESFSFEFINNIINSEKLTDLSKNPFSYEINDNDTKPQYFLNYTEMEDFYDNYLDSTMVNYQDIVDECNNKLCKLLDEEKFEEASKLRDYMLKNNISIKH